MVVGPSAPPMMPMEQASLILNPHSGTSSPTARAPRKLV